MRSSKYETRVGYSLSDIPRNVFQCVSAWLQESCSSVGLQGSSRLDGTLYGKKFLMIILGKEITKNHMNERRREK
jgi:hypothetical protein